MSPTLIIGLVLIALSALSATVNLSLHHVSYGRLAKALAARRREHWLEVYRDLEDDFIRATSILRMLSNLGLILVVFSLFEADRARNVALYYAEVFAVCAVVMLVCVVAIPLPCAKYVGESLLANILPVLKAIHMILKPLNAVMHVIDSVVRRLAGVPKPNRREETQQIEQEVLDAVDEAELHGAVDHEEKAMIRSVMELDESTVGEIMTPRTELVATHKGATLEEIKKLIQKEGHSRIPVYDENIDQVLGMVYAKDLLHVNVGPGAPGFDLMEHIREVPFVPEAKLLDDLLAEFRTGKTHAAIVLDEYGGTAGLVTIEDILEELVGEITDEYEQPEPEPVRQIGKGVIEVDSKVHVDEINELLGLDIPEGDDYETIGGFVFSAMGKIPHDGEELQRHNAKITILEAEDRKINRLRIELLAEHSGP